MRTVYKYRLDSEGRAVLQLPVEAKILLIGRDQHDDVNLWVELNPEVDEADKIQRSFYIVGTGQPVSDNAKHVGSFIDLPFIWHVYETQ